MVFWNSLAFLMIQQILAIWSLVPLPFLKPAWTSGISWFMYCWSLAWRILSITLLVCAAKSLQSYPTLCDPIDGSPPGSPVPGILQARTLEWVAISFSNELAMSKVELFQILKDDAVKVLHSICQQIWKTQQWPQDWKRSVSFQSQRKAMPKNAQTTAQLHSSHMLVK